MDHFLRNTGWVRNCSTFKKGQREGRRETEEGERGENSAMKTEPGGWEVFRKP